MNKKLKRLLSVVLTSAVLFTIFGQGMSNKAFAAEATASENVTLLPANSEWLYSDKGQDLQSVWRATYEDSEWSKGNGPFGFKVNGTVSTTEFGAVGTAADKGTTVSYGPNASAKYPTTYFRKHLTLSKTDIDSYNQIVGNFAIDDGAVIYVNGAEIKRFGMADGEVSYTTYATSNLSDPVLYRNVDLTQALKSNLKDGDNTIAVEVHQSTAGSSDLYFDMQLQAVKLPETPVSTSISKVTVTFNGDPTSAKGFTWYTPLGSDDSTLQVVEKTGEVPNFSNAMIFKGRSEVSKISANELSHKAEATGLKADTSYYFRVGDQTKDSWSEVGTFQTAPTGGAFTFIDLTDTQAQSEEEAKLSAETLAKAMETVPNAEFVIHSGDVVEHGTTEQEWAWLLNNSAPSLMNTTIVPASGNHDVRSEAFYQHFNVAAPSSSDKTSGAYYSYDYSNAHFIVLNTNESSAEFSNISAAQVQWLKDDVAAAKAKGAKWIIVNMHKGPYTTASHATDNDIIGATGERYTIAPLMNQLGIDFVLQGHDHIYARTKPILADGTAEAASKITESFNGQTIEYTVSPTGTIYLIPGTAGAKVYAKNTKPALGEAYFNLFERAEENHALKYANSRGQVQNFVGITIDGDKLSAISYEIDQNLNNKQPFVVDTFGITKPSANTTDEVKLSVADQTVAKGSTFTVPVTLENAANLVGLEGLISYDAELLKLESFELTKFRDTGATNTTTPGRIGFAGVSTAPIGANESTVVANLVFKAKADMTSDALAIISFSNVQAISHQADGETSYAKVTVSHATVTITSRVVGDMNGDNNIDLLDASAILKLVVNGTSAELAAARDVADVNGDREVNTLDVLVILQRIADGLTILDVK